MVIPTTERGPDYHYLTDHQAREWYHLPLTSFAKRIGFACLAAQIFFTLLFNKRTRLVREGPWTHLTLFTAHQLVALPLMCMLTYHGWRDWFFDEKREYLEDEIGLTASDRIWSFSNNHDNWLLGIGTGAILLWDIPTGFLSPPLRDPIMWGHHFGMFLVASTMGGLFCENGNQIGNYYSSYYFGVIELSSVFLTFVDTFHPKYIHYHGWLKNNSKTGLGKALTAINEAFRLAFAISFLCLRGLMFPYVSFVWAIPDLWEAYEKPPMGVPMWTCYLLIGMISLFAILQAYWGMLIAQQVKKALASALGGEEEEKKKK